MFDTQKSMFVRSLLQWNYMHGSIWIENISFSQNCDIKQLQANYVRATTFLFWNI